MYTRIFAVSILALIFRFILITQGAKPKIITNFTKLECVNQWPELVKIKCRIDRTSKNISALYGDILLSQDVNNLNGMYSIAVEHNQKLVNYTTFELDYCSVLKMAQTSSLLELIYGSLRRASNFPMGCPIKKNKTYYINGFTLDPKILPIYMPEVKFRTNATFLSNKREVFYITCYGQLMRK